MPTCTPSEPITSRFCLMSVGEIMSSSEEQEAHSIFYFDAIWNCRWPQQPANVRAPVLFSQNHSPGPCGWIRLTEDYGLVVSRGEPCGRRHGLYSNPFAFRTDWAA